MRSFLRSVTFVVPLLACAHPLSAQGSCEAGGFLRATIDLSRNECARVNRGNPVAKILDRSAPSEIAVVGLVRIESSAEELVRRFRDIARFKRSPSVLQVGQLGDPPRMTDIEPLEIDRGDVDDLRECRQGECGVKLSASLMERVQREVDGSEGDARKRIAALFRRILIEYANAYLEAGNAALMVYEDKEAPLSVADEFAAILEASPYLAGHAPELYRYLADYPVFELQGAEAFLYWSKEKFGLKPVISLTHATIYRPPTDRGIEVLIASKQIYASHYFEGSLGLAAVVRDREGHAYLVYVNRSRLDNLATGWSALRRRIVESRLKRGMEANLIATRQRLLAPIE